jgi:hypothetical protein
MSNPHDIKVSECDDCPFWHQEGEYSMVEYYCKHPCQYYDGNKVDEFIEHCPLKERQTVITFERPKKS